MNKFSSNQSDSILSTSWHVPMNIRCVGTIHQLNQVELVLSVNFDAGMSPTRIHRLQKWIFSFHLSDKKQCITLHPLLLMSHTCVCVWVNLTRTFNGIFRSSVFNFQRHTRTHEMIFSLPILYINELKTICVHMKFQQLMSLQFFCITITRQDIQDLSLFKRKVHYLSQNRNSFLLNQKRAF